MRSPLGWEEAERSERFRQVPQDVGSLYLVLMVENLMPGDEAKGLLLFPNIETTGTGGDPIAIRDLTPLTGSNNQVTVRDINRSNCVLKKELVYCSFDPNFAAYVPTGSQGLTRRGIAQADHSYFGSSSGSNTFAVRIQGADGTTIDVDVSNAWRSDPVYNGDKFWIQWLGFDLPPSTSDGITREYRDGRWMACDRIPGDIKIVEAPSGGIPAAVTNIPGEATCTVVERVPGSNSLRATSETFTVKNWAEVVVGKDGYRRVIVKWFLGAWWVVNSYCLNGSGTGTIGGVSSLSMLDQEDYFAMSLGSIVGAGAFSELTPNVSGYVPDVI